MEIVFNDKYMTVYRLIKVCLFCNAQNSSERQFCKVCNKAFMREATPEENAIQNDRKLAEFDDKNETKLGVNDLDN